MISLGLLALVMGLVASLLVNLAQVSRRANELSWKVAALAILDRIELDGHGALSTNLALGGNGTLLRFTVRDVNSPDFLPEPRLPGWSLASASLQREVSYQVQGASLERTVAQGASVLTVTAMGEADQFEASRTADGTFVLTLSKGRESMGKEFRSLSLRSLAAPL
jgi:hypothetical protein